MRGRPVLSSLLLASAVVVFAPQQPSLRQWIAISAVLLAMAGACLVARRWWLSARQGSAAPVAWRRGAVTLAWMLAVAAVMLVVTAQRVWQRLDDALAHDNIDRVSRVTLRVEGLPQWSPDNRRFRARVLSSMPQGVPQDIMVSWSLPGRRSPFAASAVAPWPYPEIVPGQVWRMALTLRPPAGARNPHAFDYEGHAFAQGVRAVGSVRGTPELLRDEPVASLAVAAQRLRHRIREAMQPYLGQARYGAVMTALAIGDQDGVPPGDWTTFNRTGITHLVSISGSHITMIAAFGGIAARWGWKRLRWRGRWMAERLPAQLAGAWAALLVAWMYCLLAGWGVPARRTFLMLAVIALAYAARLPLAPSRILLLAAAAVVLLDPWSLMASGFWLSFGAVAVLMAAARWQPQAVGNDMVMRERNGGMTMGDGFPPHQQNRQHFQPPLRGVPWQARHSASAWLSSRLPGWWRMLLTATRLQLAISVALLPVLARLFHEVSLVSPLANAYAIPVIGLLVTPLSLLLALFSVVPGAELLAQGAVWLGHGLLAGMMQPTQWLAAIPLASLAVPAVPWPVTALALLGLAWAMQPAGRHWRSRWRWPGWLMLLPAVLWQPGRPAQGDWRLTVLDTGQSGAAVLQTHRHAFLFDAGLRTGPAADSGSRVVAPFLRSQGIRRLDGMVVSHADLDHAGGVSGVLRAVPVRQSYSSFDLPAYLRREARLLGMPDDPPPLPQADAPCEYGRHWAVDGVSFAFLWPLPAGSADAGRTPDDANANSCVLLVRGAHHAVLFTGDIGAAQESLLADRGLPAVDVVLASHHGSRFSSAQDFVVAARPSHVIAQAGLWNRFGHPHPHVVQRWQRAGAWFWRTDLDGAVQVQSAAGQLRIDAQRQAQPRYWQLPCEVRQACE